MAPSWSLLLVSFRELTKVILRGFDETKPEPMTLSLLFLSLNLLLFFVLNLKSNIISTAIDFSQS